MPETEAERPTDGWTYFWHPLAFILLAALFVAGFAWAESPPSTSERHLDFLAAALLAGIAGLFVAHGRTILSALLAPIEPDESLTPEARSLRKQYRAVYGFSVAMMLLAAALLLLFAVSIGTGHGEWVSWFPSRGGPRYHFRF